MGYRGNGQSLGLAAWWHNSSRFKKWVWIRLCRFLANGGIVYERQPLADGESFAAYLLATRGERAIPVEVGSHRAALVWADPFPNGLRTHNLYWSDGTFNYSLIADRPAEALVTIGRGLVCGSS
jgi:hypothetical protein